MTERLHFHYQTYIEKVKFTQKLKKKKFDHIVPILFKDAVFVHFFFLNWMQIDLLHYLNENNVLKSG